MSDLGSCKRCGTCCRQGGPALHGPDLELLRSGRLTREDLIAVRRGELAFQPLASQPEPVSHEFLKLKGQQGSWCCAWYDETEQGCLRYADRPMACGLLDCTDTGPLLAIAGRDLLTRFDCMADDDPLLPLIREHEQCCPCPDLQALAHDLAKGSLDLQRQAQLEAAVNHDLAFRSRVADEWHLSVALELFCFGRPLFQLLLPLGLQAMQTPAGIRLHRCPS